MLRVAAGGEKGPEDGHEEGYGMAARNAGRALIAALLAAALGAAAARADEQKQEQFFDPQNEAAHYESHLSLTAPQKAKVLDLMKDKLELFKSAAAERRRISVETNELSVRIQKLNEQLELVQKKQTDGEAAVSEKMRALLDEDQKKKFDAMERERLRQQREFEAAHSGRGRLPDDGTQAPAGTPR